MCVCVCVCVCVHRGGGTGAVTIMLPCSFPHLCFPSCFAVGVVPFDDFAILASPRQQVAIFCCAEGENPTLMSPHDSLVDSVGACKIFSLY